MDSGKRSGDVSTVPRFGPEKQADAHVRRWRLEKWFWERFAADALDGAEPPEELWP
jgi:hypothetical protein